MDFDRFWHQRLGRPYRLYSTSHGGADKPVVVLLHGIAASSEDWGKLIPLIQKDYRCVTIDLLGFGKSPAPQWCEYTMEDHVRSLRHTVSELELTTPFILVGHSVGGLLATDYARRYPEEVKRLLLLSPPIYPPLPSILTKLAMRRTDLLMRIYKFMRTDHRLTPENFRRLGRIAPIPRPIIDNPATWLPFMRTLEHCVEQQTIIEDLTHITAPIDIFYGSLDSVVVGANIRQLAAVPNVHVHAFRGKHAIGPTGAKTLAANLGIGPPKRRLPRAILKRREGQIKTRPTRRRRPLSAGE